jgi:hypothetical protein
MAKRGRPAQGHNSTKRIAKIRAGGELLRRSITNRKFKKRRHGA